MATDLTPADPEPVLELLTAFRKSKVMFSAVELGVFEVLAKQVLSPDELAAQLGTHPRATEQLLQACAMLGLLKRSETGYSNTETATAYLTQASGQRMLGYVNYSNNVLWKMWANHSDAIREGTNRWKQTYGWDGPIFSHFFRTEEAKREFLLGMHGFGLISSPVVVNALDLGPFRTFVDLGGATGHLTVAACRRWPNLTGIVFDLPEAVALAQEMITPTDVAQRITVIGGDFFNDPLPKGDLYALGRILHDWTEAKILKLLTKIYEALPTGGAVLIAEKLVREDRLGPEWALLQSLNMLVCTEGQERTLSEYEALLKQVGFQTVVGVRTDSPLDAVLATK
jgi:acetylserotonin O-methyltransferase